MTGGTDFFLFYGGYAGARSAFHVRSSLEAGRQTNDTFVPASRMDDVSEPVFCNLLKSGVIPVNNPELYLK